MKERVSVRIDRDACAGSAQCTLRAGATFALGEDGKARALDPPGDPDDAVLRAARTCPRFAISVWRGATRLA